jgi:hypothetical protein
MQRFSFEEKALRARIRAHFRKRKNFAWIYCRKDRGGRRLVRRSRAGWGSTPKLVAS